MGRLALFACFVWTLFALPAAAEPRLALVIGNSAYGGEMGKLANPVNDAALMAATLGKLGFKVTKLVDADQKQMKRAIADFGSALVAAGPDAAGLFFYAGHGVQIAGENYLIPLHAKIEKEADAEIEAVAANWVLKQMEFAGNRINIVILDACRNNPLPRSVRSSGGGLARMDAPKGSFIAYSTAPGETAADGTGRNSPYTAALAKALPVPGIAIEETFRNARIDVLKQTAERQIPWESSSLTGAFYFQTGAAAPPEPQPQPQQQQQAAPQEQADGSIRDCPSCPALVALPAGTFTMGAMANEAGATASEYPQARISVAPFALGRFEVTRREFAAFVEATGYKPAGRCWSFAPNGKAEFVDGHDWRNPGFDQGDDEPVVCVSADDASAFAQWLARTTGRAYRLPSEAEWEYAARAGIGGAAPWGDDAEAACSHGNIADAAAAARFQGWKSVGCDDGHAFTAPAGSYSANAYGLFDMLGNVKEWTADCWNEDLSGIDASAKARRKGDCKKRAVRGSAWDGLPELNRFAYREPNNRTTAYFNYGFRIARDL